MVRLALQRRVCPWLRCVRLLQAALVLAVLTPASGMAQTPADPSRFGLPAESVERVDKRTANGKHYQLPDGSFVAIVHTGPLHYKTPAASGRTSPRRSMTMAPAG